jgi:hypothetical protein
VHLPAHSSKGSSSSSVAALLYLPRDPQLVVLVLVVLGVTTLSWVLLGLQQLTTAAVQEVPLAGVAQQLLLLPLQALLPLDVQQQVLVAVVAEGARLHRALMARSSSGRPGGRLLHCCRG